jgi:hypothetical protein
MVVSALLDDRDATVESPTSRLYTGFVREHRCIEPATLDATCGAIGRVDAPRDGARCADFCLAVAIRTLIVVCNALRGALPARLLSHAALAA